MEVPLNSGRKYCSDCVIEVNRKKAREHYKRQKEAGRRREYSLKQKENSRESHLRNKFGITSEQYEVLLEKQQGRCAICLKHHSNLKKRLAVDHDHVTREIRGLLCDFCNRRFIGRHRDAEQFHRAVEYLSTGTGWFVPEPKKKRRRRKTNK